MIKEERMYHFRTIASLFPYLKSAFERMGEWKCKECGSEDNLQIDHLRYGPDITINDLQVLCYDCHKDKTMIANDLRLSGGYCTHCQRPY